MSDTISQPFGNTLTGSTGNQQMQEPYGNNTYNDTMLAQYAGNGNLGNIDDINAVTGLINRMVNDAFIETWSYNLPYLNFMRKLPVDMANKVVQIIAPKVNKGEEFDARNGAKMIERRYADNVTATYGLNFQRQYIVSVSKDLLTRGASVDAVIRLAGQQVKNLMNQKTAELTEKINDVVSNFIMENRHKLINIHFAPKDPEHPTEDELTDLSAKIDRMNMDMSRFIGTEFSLSDVGYVTNYDDLVIDTTSELPAWFKNKVLPYAFNDSYFSTNSDIPKGDAGNSRRINVMRYLPKGVYGFVRDKNMLTIGQALDEVMPDNTGIAYTRSFNVIQNAWYAVFMDVFKRGYLISTLPDNLPVATAVSVTGIKATVTNSTGTSVDSYSLANPIALNLSVMAQGSITPENADIHLPSEHHVKITIVDKDGKQKAKTAKTLVDELDRIMFDDKKLSEGDVITYDVTSNYFNPTSDEDQTPYTASVSLNIVK